MNIGKKPQTHGRELQFLYFLLESSDVLGYNVARLNWGVLDKRGLDFVKNLSMIVWLTQLGLSVAVPLAGFVWLGVWLRQRFDWGVWVVIVGVALGLICAADGLRTSLKAMDRIAKDKKEDKPPVSFNDHE